MHATMCAWLEVIGYNTNLVERDDAPKSYADLLDPKWKGKLVKAHPGYSGAILTATFLLVRELGWPYLEKLASRKSCRCSPRPIRRRRFSSANAPSWPTATTTASFLLKDRGQPVEIVYPTEGAPLIIVPNGIFRSAPNPNAARLFQSFLFSAEAQQVLVDGFAHRSFHALVKEKAGPNAALGDQTAQGRSGRGTGADRGDQDAVREDFRGVA